MWTEGSLTKCAVANKKEESPRGAKYRGSQTLVSVTHEELALLEKAHTANSRSHTIQRTCLSSHLPAGLGVFPHSLLLVEGQMEAHEIPYTGTVNHINMATHSCMCSKHIYIHRATHKHAAIPRCWNPLHKNALIYNVSLIAPCVCYYTIQQYLTCRISTRRQRL